MTAIIIPKHVIPQEKITLSRKKIKAKRKRRISRKSYRARLHFAPRNLYRKRKFPLERIRKLVIRNFGVTKPLHGSLFIKHKRRNTFLALSREVKNKARNKFGKRTRKPQFLVVLQCLWDN